MHVLADVYPSVPQRGAPSFSVLTSRELKPKWEARRLESLKMRRVRRVRGEDDSEEDVEESSEEESVA